MIRCVWIIMTWKQSKEEKKCNCLH